MTIQAFSVYERNRIDYDNGEDAGKKRYVSFSIHPKFNYEIIRIPRTAFVYMGVDIMKDTSQRLTVLACWLIAIVPGIYLINYLGARLFDLPAVFYYVLLILAAAGYLVLLFLGRWLYRQIKNSRQGNESEA